jgi:glycosyltransferase involved in cell wall biosynthesis
LADRDGDAFLLAPVDASIQFAEHVVNLWSNPERRRAMGKAGRALYETHFRFDAIAAKLLSSLESGTTI